MRSSRAGATSTEACKLVGVAIGCGVVSPQPQFNREVVDGRRWVVGKLDLSTTVFPTSHHPPPTTFFSHNSCMKSLAPLLILASGALFAADLKVVEEIIAKCNGDIVTRSDIEKAQKELLEAARRDPTLQPRVPEE